MVCVPVSKYEQERRAFALGADLVEYNLGDHKVVLGPDTRLIDRDWSHSPGADIISYHNFEETPTDLEGLLYRLRKKPARFYKIAAMARSSLDTLRMVKLTEKYPDLIGICMGEDGKPSRILGKSPIVYAALSYGEATAPGQISLEEMLHLYRIREKRQPYGLIGDPVIQSIGHLYHNRERLYVKMRILKEQLSSFFKQACFSGLSVTSPLKEAVIPYLDELDPLAAEIGAVNTIVFDQGRKIGFNTDGEGAIKALGDVKAKRILILGTGGASKAIAYEACRQGAEVSVLGRNCPSSFIPYDILVNTAPGKIPVEILGGTTVMDIVFHESSILKEALEKKCRCIHPEEMFMHQAEAQKKIWGNP